MHPFVRSTAYAVIAGVLFFTALDGVEVAHAQEPAPAKSEEKTGHKSKTLIDLYKEGGWVMHLIALTSVATLATLAYCMVAVNKKKVLPAALTAALNDALQAQDVALALQLCERTPSVIGTVINESLQKAGTGVAEYTKADLEAAAAESIFHEETRLMLWVNMLNAFAAVAPMIGLLGTVSGMIQSFEKLSQGASKASDFAGGIGEAMVGTAGGLLVAIPAMFAYFYFKNTLQALMSDVARVASNLIGRFVTGTPTAPRGGIRMIARRRHSETIGFQIAPMIDITWILIIFFMVTMHLVENEFAVEVALPIASAAEIPTDLQGRVIVNIDPSGAYFVGNQRMTLAELTAHLKMRMIQYPPLKVYLRADATIPAQKTKEFYRACAEATAVEVILASFREGNN